jgi:SAM-dependent methyltransferase
MTDHFVGDDNIDWCQHAVDQANKAQAGFTFTDQFDYFMDLLPRYISWPAVDLGCNIGNWVPIFKSYHMQYVGIDASQTAIDIARKRYPEDNFMCMRAEELQLDYRVKLVFCHTVLQHMKLDTKKIVVANIARVLLPGGLFVFQEKMDVSTATTLTHDEWIEFNRQFGLNFIRYDDKTGGMVFQGGKDATDKTSG